MYRIPRLLAALAMSACAQTPDQSPAPAVTVAGPFGEHGYHCPPARTIVPRETPEQTIRWIYAGPDPADPDGCLMNVNGKVGSYLFGVFTKNIRQAADFAAAYRKALSGPPGTAAEFRYVLYDGQNYNERVENEAVESLQIGRQARQTLRIALTETALGGGNFVVVRRRWFDLQTGAMIREAYQQVSGLRPLNAPTNLDWTATRIEVLGS
jgi:hypothetical protein